MKCHAFRSNPDRRQRLDDAPEDGEQVQNKTRELIKMRFLLTETLSVRCECYLSPNAWLYLKDSPELRSIARLAIERIISERRSHLGGNNEKPQGS